MLRRVLIVDDEVNVRRTLAVGLRLSGFDVTEADGSDEAMTCLRDGHFDVALLDLMLPGVNGLELARWILTSCPAVRVILMSGYHLSERQIARAEAGIRAFLPKPFSVEAAARACEEALDEGRRRAVG